jgi:hypothetical protein
MQNFKVADLVHDDGHWNLALLNHWLPVHVLRKLVASLLRILQGRISELVLLMANWIDIFFCQKIMQSPQLTN